MLIQCYHDTGILFQNISNIFNIITRLCDACILGNNLGWCRIITWIPIIFVPTIYIFFPNKY